MNSRYIFDELMMKTEVHWLHRRQNVDGRTREYLLRRVLRILLRIHIGFKKWELVLLRMSWKVDVAGVLSTKLADEIQVLRMKKCFSIAKYYALIMKKCQDIIKKWAINVVWTFSYWNLTLKWILSQVRQCNAIRSKYRNFNFKKMLSNLNISINRYFQTKAM